MDTDVKRGSIPDIPAPMQVSPYLIQRCRNEIDADWKKCVRSVSAIFSKYKNGLSEIGEGFQIGPFVPVPAGSRLGRYGYIGRGFEASSPIVVGDLTMISTDVHIVGDDHGIDDKENPIRLAFRWRHRVTVFEADVWVGHRVTIKAGVRLGIGAVVAAGSVVTRDVAPFSVVGGSPARVIRERFSLDDRIFHEKLLCI